MYLGVLYIVTILLDLALMLFFGFKKKVRQHPMARLLHRLAVVITITVFSSVLAILLPQKEISLFFQTLHYASTEWMLIYLMLFLEFYVGNVNATMKSRVIVYIYSAASSISLLSNCIFHHVVDNERVLVNEIENFYRFTNKSPYYQVHLYFCYLLVLFIFLVLLGGWIKSVKMYRKKYWMAMIMLMITVALDAICTIKGFAHDFSLYGYITLAFFFLYFTVYYLPNDVINKMLSLMVADSHNGAVCFDEKDKCVYINDEVRSFYEKEVDYVFIEKRFKEILGVENFKDGKENKWLHEISLFDGVRYFDLTFAKLYDDRNEYVGSYFTINDKTEDMERFKQERYKATHDSLTDLHNREYFYERVMEVKKENPDVAYYIVCTDIKDFKLINDLFGYEMGNEILRRYADKLKRSLPDGVISARLVSDRFAVCIPKKDFHEDYLIACLDDAQSLLSTSEFQLHIHAGIYEIRPEDEDVSVMCDHANMAIRTVKNDYDAIAVFYDDKLMNKMMNSKLMISEFDNALTNNQFVMYLQPQVNPDGSVVGAEALVRWLHPEKGMISPGEFIPVFEEAGLIHRLDQCIWEQAAKKLQEWKNQGKDNMHISVNISTKDFYYIDLYKVFTELVEKYEISPEKLKLEITESALMQDMDKQLELITRLQKYGFHVEIDDFGSGYSSLNMLKDLKADVLKIDMGFLQEIKDHERTKIILGMVVDLAKRLQMTVITEGVETKNQVEYLTEVGCDMFQGFYFARPIAVTEFENEYL